MPLSALAPTSVRVSPSGSRKSASTGYVAVAFCSTRISPVRTCTGASSRAPSRTVTVTRAVDGAFAPRPSLTVYENEALPLASGGTASCSARPPYTGCRVPSSAGSGSTSVMTRIPQSEDVSLSMTGRIVVRPGRTPNSSSTAFGAPDAGVHSGTSCCVVRSPWLSSVSSCCSSSGTTSDQSGSRSSVSSSGSQSRPSTVSFSATTCRFTRNTRWSVLVTPSRSSSSSGCPSHRRR